MYALVKDKKIVKYFAYPKGFTLNDNQYPADIFTKWTKEQKESLGIYEVIFDDSNKKDEEYYINTNQSFKFANGKVTASYGTAFDKALEDVDAVDEDGNPILQDGVQVVIYGLKTNKKSVIKQQASGLLAPTDWHVIKANEVEGYTVPTEVSTFRADVRTKSNEMETAIDACTTVEQLKSLYEYTNTGTEENPVITRPLPEFPKEVI
jgi:hypothetical protein